MLRRWVLWLLPINLFYPVSRWVAPACLADICGTQVEVIDLGHGLWLCVASDRRARERAKAAAKKQNTRQAKIDRLQAQMKALRSNEAHDAR
jgi:hypothetical protein